MDQHEDTLVRTLANLHAMIAELQAAHDALSDDLDDMYASYQRHHLKLALISLGAAGYDLRKAMVAHGAGTPEWWSERRNLLIEVPF